MNDAALLAAIPAVIAAMGGIIKLVLNALDRVEQRQETFLGNHMSGNTKALQDLTSAIQKHEAKSELELLRLRTALQQAGIKAPEVSSQDES